ncbi:MAG: FAD:protein FMN transferase [Sphingobacterium sp.]
MLLRTLFIGMMLFGCWCYAQQPNSALNKHEIFGTAQGTTYTITYFQADPIVSKTSLDSIFHVLDESMSLYLANSQIVRFNQPGTDQLVLDEHMRKVLEKSFEVYKKSKGRFDVTVKPLVSLWGFGPDGPSKLPDSLAVQQALERIGMDKLKLKGNNLQKITPGVEIDLNGIAQGYTVDVLYDFLRAQQLQHFIVEVGGEIRTSGHKPGGQPFKILVQRPEHLAEGDDFILHIVDKSVTTSGSYEKFRDVNGYRFSHHMDPKTGYPLSSSTISVTVVSEEAIDADAYDNVFMAMDPAAAIEFANSENKIDIYLMYLDEGVVKEAYSEGFSKYLSTN